MDAMLQILDKKQATGILGSLSIGLSSLTGVFSTENLRMDDSLMKKYQEMLKNFQNKASGFQDQ